MRPSNLQEFIGQSHLLGEGKSLRRAIELGGLHSMVLWGPPGTGKTTLARLMAGYCKARFLRISAVLAGVKEIREAISQARESRAQGQSTVLFVDEAHRFNKSQQDAFLPHVEDGTLIFIGATTENPAFELNNALLSRIRVYVLRALSLDEIRLILQRALQEEQGLGNRKLAIRDASLHELAQAADGDGRRALNFLEICADLSASTAGHEMILPETVSEVITGGGPRFDKGGDIFYDQISALHKSIRGSDPDAALYWFARMLEGGCDPHYLARRIVRMASEDVGNADPRGLQVSLDAWDAYGRLGSPEGELALAQAVLYLASVPKSNAVYTAFQAAMQDARRSGSLEVPLHLRNAPTRLMQELGHGRGYRYAHDEAGAFAAGERYFPEGLEERRYYRPRDQGLEIRIRERLERLRAANREAGGRKGTPRR
nr:MAG: putative ATPase [Candidatus Kentron sp. TUN]